MKILLIKPRVYSDTVIPPVGLGYLASNIDREHDVKIIDCLKDKINLKELNAAVKGYDPDIVGIQVYNIDKHVAREYLEKIKDLNTDIVSVIGGPYPSCEPSRVFDYFGNVLDYAFCGEAEKGFTSLIKKLSNDETCDSFEEINGLIWRKDGIIEVNANEYSDNLDELGFPSWDLLKPEDYPPSPIGAFMKQYPVAPVLVSRGCPYECSFCAGSRITGTTVRYRSVSSMMEEFKLLYEKHGIREIHILDDNFTYSRDYVRRFCESLLEQKIDLKIACPNGIRIDTLDGDLLQLMKKAGFYVVHIGIESGSQKILNYMGKVLEIGFIEKRIKEIRSAGLDICGYFIMGYPGETADDIKDTIKLALKLPLTRAMFMNFLPIPGTQIYDQLKQSGSLKDDEYDRNTFYNANCTVGPLTKRQLKLLQIKAFLLFYLRPGILLGNIFRMYNVRHMMYIAGRVLRIVTNA
ncbi:MAG: radical SAM protein [Elusimicrobiota bacterium]